MNQSILTYLNEKGILSPLDMHFARFMARLAGAHSPELLLASALVSCFQAQGHICLDLTTVGRSPLLNGTGEDEAILWPDPEEWTWILLKSSVVGRPGDFCPLVLDDCSRLYLYRYWEYQERLAHDIKRRVQDHGPTVDAPLLKKGLDRLFSDDDSGPDYGPDSKYGPNHDIGPVDWQKMAAMTALLKRFCVISGGPGTGKTTTVAKIMALLLEQASPGRIRTALAAPTGKAASRLREAVQKAKDKLRCANEVKEKIPTETSTLHRLLGTIPGSPYFRHHAHNPLPVDVMIVDEASMVDMALMSKLVQALPAHARLILLGDKDQLASVEAGAVMGDFCDSGREHRFSEKFIREIKQIDPGLFPIQPKANPQSGLCDCMVHLQKSYRFGSHSGIKAVGRAVNQGDRTLSLALLKDDQYEDIQWKGLPKPDSLSKALQDLVIEGHQAVLKAKDPWDAFKGFERFRILCALRQGPYGVSVVNRLSAQILKGAGLIDPEKPWYSGRPVLITRNDYHLGLYNGDVGIVLSDPDANGELRVFFPGPDDRLKKIHPVRLPAHETVYAMTVHRSQGSEFDHVLLLLPDKDVPLLTRELIYTGMTRARHRVDVWGKEDVFQNAVSRRTERASGLRDALWGR